MTKELESLIRKAKELSEKATPGPWKTKQDFQDWGFPYTYLIHRYEHETFPLQVNDRGVVVCVNNTPENRGYCEKTKADAEFIAASRTMVPELATALEEALKQIKELKSEIESRDESDLERRLFCD